MNIHETKHQPTTAQPSSPIRSQLLSSSRRTAPVNSQSQGRKEIRQRAKPAAHGQRHDSLKEKESVRGNYRTDESTLLLVVTKKFIPSIYFHLGVFLKSKTGFI